MFAQHAHHGGRRGMVAFLLPVAMTRWPAMSRRLRSCVRRCRATASIASFGDFGAADRLAPGAGRLVAFQGAVADVGVLLGHA